MIDFLKECNISQNTIDKLYDKYPSELFNLNCNEEDCIEIINYLKNIGIKNIEDLLIMKIDLFYESKEEIEKIFTQHNVEEIVKKINSDPLEIYTLFK